MTHIAHPPARPTTAKAPPAREREETRQRLLEMIRRNEALRRAKPR